LLYVCFFWITGSHNFRRIKVEQYFKGNNKREIMIFAIRMKSPVLRAGSEFNGSAVND
jgi:hypothetical protein